MARAEKAEPEQALGSCRENGGPKRREGRAYTQNPAPVQANVLWRAQAHNAPGLPGLSAAHLRL